METINIKAFNANITQIKALKAFLKNAKIDFEISKEIPYNREFVAMIKKGEEQIAEGKGIKMSVADFKKLCE